MKQLLTLVKIEGRLGIRGIDGIFFGIIMPIGIALLIGVIGGDQPAYEGAEFSYIESSFASLITVGICATAFMGIPLTISDYRDKKILKHYFVTPISPGILLLTQVIINMITAITSAFGVYLTVKLAYGYEMKGAVLEFLLSFLLVLASMYGIGMMMASVCNSVKKANMVCTLVYFPMLFLSGATIPYEILPKTLQRFSDILPLTQGIKLLKGCSLGTAETILVLPIVVMVGCAVVGTVVWSG